MPNGQRLLLIFVNKDDLESRLIRPFRHLTLVVFERRLPMVLWIGEVIFLLPLNAAAVLMDDTVVAPSLHFPEQLGNCNTERGSVIWSGPALQTRNVYPFSPVTFRLAVGCCVEEGPIPTGGLFEEYPERTIVVVIKFSEFC